MLGLKHNVEIGRAPSFDLTLRKDIVVTWNNNDVRGDIHFPRFEYQYWQQKVPCKTFIDDIPVLYGQEKPGFLFRDRVCGFDFVGAIFYLLSRQEEYLQDHRDLWGCFSAYYSILYEHGVLQRPMINYYLLHLKNELIATVQRKRIPLTQYPCWPGEKQFAICLTHDVDQVGYNSLTLGLRNAQRALGEKAILQPARSVLGGARDSLRYRGPNSPCNFEQWLKVEDEVNARSSFYFIPFFKERHKWDSAYSFNDRVVFNGKRAMVSEMMREMRSGGWEVGLHGSYYSFNDVARLSAERQAVESAVRGKITGGRQHYLHLKVPDTWRAQQAASLEYDTTLGYNEEIGHRAGIALPFTVYDLDQDQELALIEIPLTIQDNVLVNYLRLDLNGALKRCISIIDEVASVGGVVTLLWHPNSYSNRELWTAYRELLSYSESKGAWLTSASNIIEYWRKRMAQLLAEETYSQKLYASGSD